MGSSATKGGPQYRGFAKTDSALMSALGANAVRTYGPLTDLDVLDVLWRRGIYVLNTVYISSNDTIDSVALSVRAVMHHPSILMWVVGNEWNYNKLYSGMDSERALSRVAEVAQLIKAIDQTHPVATVYGMLPKRAQVESLRHVDVWGIIAYTGISFGDLFADWSRLSKKPMFVAEFGADAYNAKANAVDEGDQALAVGALTKEIVAHSVHRGGPCLGGFVFELTDEWWKDETGGLSRHDVGGVAPGGGPFPDATFNEEYWGLVRYDGTARLAYRAYAQVLPPDGHADEAQGDALSKIVPGYRLRACGASPDCAGVLGNCCPGEDGDFRACCSDRARRAFPRQGGGDWTPATVVEGGDEPSPAPATTSRLRRDGGGGHGVRMVGGGGGGAARGAGHPLVTTIAVGDPPQTLRCLLDSSSADLWIPSSTCRTCTDFEAFEREERSWSARSTSAGTFPSSQGRQPRLGAVTVSEGARSIRGLAFRGTLRLGSMLFENLSYIVVDDEDLPPERTWDGICGLGWQQLAEVDSPLYERLRGQSRPALVAIVPSRDHETYLVLGEIPEDALRKETLSWASAEPFARPPKPGELGRDPSWVTSGGLALLGRDPVPTRFLVDTSTDQALLVPPSQYDTVVAALLPDGALDDGGACYFAAGRNVFCDCDAVHRRRAPPPLRVYLGGQPFERWLHELFVRVRDTETGGEVCALQVRANSLGSSGIPDLLRGIPDDGKPGARGGASPTGLRSSGARPSRGGAPAASGPGRPAFAGASGNPEGGIDASRTSVEAADRIVEVSWLTPQGMMCTNVTWWNRGVKIRRESHCQKRVGTADAERADPGENFQRRLSALPTTTDLPADEVWVLGGVFLARLVTIFDFDARRIGFAERRLDADEMPEVGATKATSSGRRTPRSKDAGRTSGPRFFQPWALPLLSGLVVGGVALGAGLHLQRTHGYYLLHGLEPSGAEEPLVPAPRQQRRPNAEMGSLPSQGEAEGSQFVAGVLHGLGK